MKATRWITLGLAIASLGCGMWIIAAGAVYFFTALPTPPPEFDRTQLLIESGICLLAPMTLALASILVWRFGKHVEVSSTPRIGRAEPANAANIDRYVNKMIEILFRQPWRAQQLDVDSRPIIEAETRHALARLDPVGQGRVLIFLHSAGLLSGTAPIRLYGIDLSNIDLRFAPLRGVNLSGADLRRARLIGADLRECDLRGANLSEGDLRMTWLDGAILDGCNLQQARLHRASLRGASMDRTDLRGANLWSADLHDARMSTAVGSDDPVSIPTT